MKSLEIEDIKEILRIEIRKQILHAHHVDLGTNKWSDTGVEESLETAEKKDSNLREILKNLIILEINPIQFLNQNPF